MRRTGPTLALGLAAAAAGLFLFGLFLGLVPAMAHNARAEADFVPITSNAGLNLFIGNNPRARGYYQVPPGMNTEQDPRGARLAERAEGRRGLSSAAISRWWKGRAMGWIAAHPGGFLVNTFRKLALLFSAGEIPQIYHQRAMAAELPFLRAPLVTFLLLFPLAGIGFVAGLRRDGSNRAGVALLAFYAGGLALSLLPFFVTARYRLPLAPAFCAAGGIGVAALVGTVRGRRWRRLAVYGAVGIVLAALSLTVERLQPYGQEDVSRFESMRAALLMQAGRVGEAKSLLERRAAEAPTPGIWSNLGMIYQNEPGGLARAAEAYEKAARLEPDDARIWFNLSQTLLRLNRRGPARAALERALALDPDVQPLAWYNLAVLRKLAGDRAGARQAVEEFLKRQPGDAQALALLQSLSPPGPKSQGPPARKAQ